MGLIQADIWELSSSYEESHGCRGLGRENGEVDDDGVSSLSGQVDTNTINGGRKCLGRVIMDSALAMVSGRCLRDMLGETASRHWGCTIMVSIDGSSNDL